MSRITFTLTAYPDEVDVRDNAMASGDDDVDREYEEAILSRLDYGDVWAWAVVVVTARCGEFEGRDVLGGCTYEDAEDFMKDQYFEDMRRVALEDLLSTLESAAWLHMELANDVSADGVDLDQFDVEVLC